MAEFLSRDGWKIVKLSATGPAADVTVTAGGAANVDLTIGTSMYNVKAIEALVSVSGLPDGAVLAGVSYPDLSTVRLRVFNPTGADVTVSAGSVTAYVLAKAL